MSKPTCVIQAPLWTRSGYGDWGMSIAKSLLRYDKFEVHLAPTRWGQCSRKNLMDDLGEPYLQNLILKSPLPKQPDIFMQCTIPNEFHTPAKYNIGVTAGIETTLPRVDWIEGINRMDLTFCLSQHVYDVFASTNFTREHKDGRKEIIKVQKPMEVLNWGANTSIFHKTNTIDQSINEFMTKIPEEFAFLHVGQWTSGGLYNDRKDIGNLIKNFLEAFRGAKTKPCLIVKTSGAAICTMDKYDMLGRLKEIERQVQGVEKEKADLPNVYLLYGELTEPEMNSLFNHPKVKAHLSFTHGEGFGHPLLLATLSGKPVIAPEWSGHLDFLNREYARFFKGELKEVEAGCVNEWIIKESKWFYVDYKAAQERMKGIFYYYGSYLEDYEKLRQENMEKFSEEAIDKVFHALLDTYVPKFAVQEKIILPRLKKISGPSVATIKD